MTREAITRKELVAAAALALAMLIVCVGCVGKPQVVEVPIAVPPEKVILPPRPIYQTASMPAGATYQQKLTWMAQDYAACRAQEDQLRILLGPFVVNPDPSTPPK